MSEFMRKPTPIIEDRGEGWFAPARPRPHARRPGLFNVIRYIRYSQISHWCRDDYEPLHGSIRILRRQVVFANSPESVKYFLATAHDNYERKSPQLRRALEPIVGSGLFISDGATWKKRRPLIVDIAHKSRLSEFAPSMEGVIGDISARWATLKPGDVVDMNAEMGELTAKVLSRALFGNHISQEAVEDVVEGIKGYMTHVDAFNLGYFLGRDEGSPVRLTGTLRDNLMRLHRVVDGVIEHHLAGKGDESSMMQSLIKYRNKHPDAEITVQALRDEAANIFGAGQETTATTLTWVWYLIANAPWVEAAVLDELAAVCGDRPPVVADVPKLDLCRAVIDETLRLYPPGALIARQAVNDDTFMDMKVDRAALILISPWLLHRMEAYWDQPHRFMPERFMGSNRPTPYTYLPFALGPRICSGLSFGLTESVLAFATLIQRYRVRMVPGTRVEPVGRITLKPLAGLPVTLERRF